MDKEISVIVPTYNRANQLGACLDCLLNQSLDKNKYEIIIVNDGSNDATLKVIEAYQNNNPGIFIYVEQPNRGAAAARNRGAKIAKGDILYFLDDDCLVRNNVLSNIINEFKTFGEKVCMGGFNVGGKQNIIGHTVNLLCCSQSKNYKYRYNVEYLSSSSLCVKRSSFLEEGGFDENIGMGEDTEWSYRMRLEGYKILKTPKIIACHQHSRNTLRKMMMQTFEWGSKTDYEILIKYKSLLEKDTSMEFRSKFIFRVGKTLLSLPPTTSFLLLCLMFLPLTFVYTVFSCARVIRFKKEIIFLSPLVFIRELSWSCGHLVYFFRRRRIAMHRQRKGFREILHYNLHKNKLKTPLYLILFVTNNCNARCLHCFYWKRIKEEKAEMTIDEYRDISSGLGFLEKISLTGGEPFLRNDLASIAEIFYRNNHCKTIGITSNGICSDKIITETKKILSLCPKSNLGLCLGVDGLGKVHNQARGVENGFEQLIETCHRLTSLKRKHPRINLSLNFTLTDKNVDEFIPLYEFVKKNLPDYWPFGFSVLLPKDLDDKAIAGKPKDFNLNRPGLAEIQRLVNMIENDFRKEGSLDLKYYLEKSFFNHTLQIMHKNKQIIKCLAGHLCAVIDELGNVYFCEFLKNIGNVKHKPFKDIWFSHEAKLQRREIASGKCSCYSPYFQNLNLKYQLCNPVILYKMLKGFA